VKRNSIDPQSPAIALAYWRQIRSRNRYDRTVTRRRTPISCMRPTVNLRVTVVDASIANNSRGNFDKRSITRPNFLLMIAAFRPSDVNVEIKFLVGFLPRIKMYGSLKGANGYRAIIPDLACRLD